MMRWFVCLLLVGMALGVVSCEDTDSGNNIVMTLNGEEIDSVSVSKNANVRIGFSYVEESLSEGEHTSQWFLDRADGTYSFPGKQTTFAHTGGDRTLPWGFRFFSGAPVGTRRLSVRIDGEEVASREFELTE